MRVLVIGGNGMAGHALVRYLESRTAYDVFFTTRDLRQPGGLFLDAREPLMTEKLVEAVSPDIVVNCTGILNRQAEINELDAYAVNSLFPHQLKAAVSRNGGRLMHISTDCVFSGEKGDYTEKDVPDGTSVYARTKRLGEIHEPPHLTIRTSIVGPEIRRNGIGLLEWFLKQSGTVPGYTNVWWNGVTTLELAKAVHSLIERPSAGLLHLTAPEKISKYELLHKFKHHFRQSGVTIAPDESFVLDRTLAVTRTNVAHTVPDYETMLAELAEWMGYR